MAITFTELKDSRQVTIAERGKNSNQVRRYIVEGSDDITDIIDTARTQLPVVLGDLVRDTVGPCERQGPSVWYLTVTYIDPEYKPSYGGGGSTQRPVDSWFFSFDITGEPTAITHSDPALVNAYPATGVTAPDWDGGIRWNGTEFEGVDKLVPQMEFRITYRKARGQITLAYINTLRKLVATVNNSAFYGFPAGAVLFLGASGAQSTDSDPEIEYRFRVGYNADGSDYPNLNIGGISCSKAAHDYLWVHYMSSVDATAKALVKSPIAVYVHEIYPYSDFSLIGIGGT